MTAPAPAAVDVEALRAQAETLIAAHLPGGGWRFAFDTAKRRAGCCHYDSRRITVSKHLAAKTDAAGFAQIVLHEIAHALAGHAAAHGPAWRAHAARVGYTGSRLYTGEGVEELAPWLGRCPAGHEVARFRRPAKPSSCSVCAPRFSRRHLIRWTRRDEETTA